MKSYKGNPIVKWFKWRIDKNKNVISIINGGTGSGKTYAALQLGVETAEEFDTNFSIKDNVAFNFSDLLKKTQLPQNQKPGTCFVFEEVGSMGAGASSREWQSKANKFFFSFLQTTRHRRQILILTCPNFNYLEKGARELCHLQMEMMGINFQQKISHVKPYLLQINNRSGKIYFKFMRFSIDGIKSKLKILNVRYPPEDIVRDYEKVKTAFTTALNKSILDAGEDDGKSKRSYKVDPQVIFALADKGLKNQEIADKYKISLGTVKYHKARRKKANQEVK